MERTADQPPTSSANHTWHEFIALPDDDRRELVDGQLIEIEVPTRLHEWIVAVLVRHLGAWAMANRTGIVLASGYKVRIRDDHGFMPDVQFFRRGGRPVPDDGLAAGAPDLAVEVISRSSGRYDRVVKLDGYAAIGVPEYWIVDPERRTLERLLLEASGGYRVADVLAGDARLEPPSLPGLVVELSELWQLPEWFER